MPRSCPELDCVRHLLPRRVIAAAEQRARSIGVGAERVLICADAMTEEAYLAALAHSLGTSYETLDGVARDDCPLDDDRLIDAAAAGLLPLRQGPDITWIIAPRNLMARQLADPQQAQPACLGRFRLTSADRLRRFAEHHSRQALGRRAADGLRLSRPLFSNAPRSPVRRTVVALASTMLAFAFFVGAPLLVIETLSGLLCALFLAASMLRLLSVGFGAAASPARPSGEDRRLPIYTVICALYREARVVDDLVAAIRALDYPPEKLDVKFVLEADDEETQCALARHRLGPPFEIIIAPNIGPRTKPKALNVALPFARGVYTVVYDAEDRPDPDQLRCALDAFRAGDSQLACVQASLTIDNVDENWLTRMFAANYAGHFDAFLPGLAAMALPFPLGGSSNHFPTAVLRKVGAWDPHNVTEDADLGIRLYRLGYRSAILPSTTHEEAPPRFTTWLGQRTRWYKGWMQTWLVHMRRPDHLMRELGAGGAIALQIFLAANVLAALVHPLFMFGLGVAWLALPTAWASAVINNATPIFAASLVSCYGSTILVDLIGLRRRGLLAHGWILLLTPLYWFLLSFAAWRALFELLEDPQRWVKTEHGLAKRPRTVPMRRGRSTLRDKVQVGLAPPIAPIRLMRMRRDMVLDRR